MYNTKWVEHNGRRSYRQGGKELGRGLELMKGNKNVTQVDRGESEDGTGYKLGLVDEGGESGNICLFKTLKI